MDTEKTGIFAYATLPEEKLLEHFDTSLSDGLSSQQGEERIATAGYNEITASPVHWSEIAITAV